MHQSVFAMKARRAPPRPPCDRAAGQPQCRSGSGYRPTLAPRLPLRGARAETKRDDGSAYDHDDLANAEICARFRARWPTIASVSASDWICVGTSTRARDYRPDHTCSCCHRRLGRDFCDHAFNYGDGIDACRLLRGRQRIDFRGFPHGRLFERLPACSRGSYVASTSTTTAHS